MTGNGFPKNSFIASMTRTSILFVLLFVYSLPLVGQYSQEEVDTYFSWFRRIEPPSFPQGWGPSPLFDDDFWPARKAFWRT